MGPTLIFDKSVLEALNPYEAMWMDQFFISNITPLFFIETLADLEKQVRTGRTPEDVVGNLAYKTPDLSSKPSAHHTTLIEGELWAGEAVDMEYGRVIISGGKTYELEGKTGVVFQPSAEEEAFTRWQKHQFLDLERLTAKSWRQGLSNIDLERNYRFFQKFYPIGKPKTFAGVKKLTDFQIDEPDQESVLIFGMTLLGIVPSAQAEVVKRWKTIGRPSLRKFAPYFSYVFSVDLFFNLAIAADLIGRGRPSHKIDLAYLYYLPFCMVFTSNDKLHAEIVPFFLRDNQTFVPGREFKDALANLDAHYDAMPDEVKQGGLSSFAFNPPASGSFLIAQLWDKHMSSKWRERVTNLKPQPGSDIGNKLMAEIKKFKERGTPVPADRIKPSDEADSMVIERSVRGRIGKWARFPPEIMNRQKNEHGEWEDKGTP